MERIAILIKSGSTIRSLDELRYIWDIKSDSTLYNLLQRYKKNKILISYGHGLWGFYNYDCIELASKIKFPSYISLETVMQNEGIIFQDYSQTTTLISDNSLSLNIDHRNYIFSKIKNDTLTNTLGIKNNGKYMIASKERAICDRIYLTPNYYFDNLSGLDIELLDRLKDIYNKRTSLAIKNIIDEYRNK